VFLDGAVKGAILDRLVDNAYRINGVSPATEATPAPPEPTTT